VDVVWILISRIEKIRLCSLSLSDPSLVNIYRYKTYRDLYNKDIHAAKTNFKKKNLLNINPIKKNTWRTIKTAINKDKGKTPEILSHKINENIISDPKHLADLFNEFFTSMPSKIVANTLSHLRDGGGDVYW
jgi:hypothetical protein